MDSEEKIKISDSTFCAFDLETTGTNPVVNRIIEFAFIKFTMDGVVETFHSLINPECEISEDSFVIHGITDDMVSSAPLLDTKIDEIENFIKDSILVIQNAQFDLSFLMQAFIRKSRPFPEYKVFDTVVLARKAFPDFENHKLGTLCKNLNIDTVFHRAEGDTLGCMEVFRSVIRHIDPKSVMTIGDLNSYHGRQKIKPLPKVIANLTNVPFRTKIKWKKPTTIEYRKSDNEVSSRIIIPYDFIRYGKDKYLRAFCFLRKEERCFKVNRIVKILS